MLLASGVYYYIFQELPSEASLPKVSSAGFNFSWEKKKDKKKNNRQKNNYQPLNEHDIYLGQLTIFFAVLQSLPGHTGLILRCQARDRNTFIKQR